MSTPIPLRKLLSTIIIVLFPMWSFSQENFFSEDGFPAGDPQLKWAAFPFYNLDNLNGVKSDNAPDGDGGIGILTNENAGGFSSLSYAVTQQVDDFRLESMVYCPVTKGDKGPLVGLAFLIDPFQGDFYRLVCDFKSSKPSLNLAFVGKTTRNYPVYLNFWENKELPGGIPKVSGWHKMAVEVQNGELTAYFDGKLLSGGPFSVDRIKKGFVGVYANYVGGLGAATTRVDSFQLRFLLRGVQTRLVTASF